MKLLEWANKNSGAITALATVALAILTSLYVVFTKAAVNKAADSAKSAVQSARATEQAAEVTRISAILSTVPLLVPWVPELTGNVSVFNRGNSTSHNLRWKILIDDTVLADGEDQQVINPHIPRSVGSRLGHCLPR